MYISPRIATCILVAISAMTLAACGQQSTEQTTPEAATSSSVSAHSAPATNLQIASWGPQSTKAGTAFNAQPDGTAALWMNVNQSLTGENVMIEFNDTPLKAIVAGNVVSALVPAKLYANPGAFKVHIVAGEGAHSIRSNDVTFTVQ